MSHRILDFSLHPTRLRMRMKQLVVQSDESGPITIPMEDVAVILVSHPQVTFSQACLAGIAENGGVLIACNEKSLPVGMFAPLVGHHQPVRRVQIQIEASLPLQKRAWQQIVRAKLAAQGELLGQLFGEDCGLKNMISRVKSGDPANIEAGAAKRYWRKLFGEVKFRRLPDGEDPINLRLNFGYGVLRGIVARAICAAGFNPTIGLHHCNQYNAYCLADDLMEPFRPIVDQAVYKQTDCGKKADEGLTPEVKKELIGPLLARYSISGEYRTLFDCTAKLAQSLVPFFAKESKTLDLPDSMTAQNIPPPF